MLPSWPLPALSGTGFDTLKSIVAHTLRAHTPHWDQSKPRLPIDRAFSIHGLGTVVTGTLSGAPLKMDQPVVIQPGRNHDKKSNPFNITMRLKAMFTQDAGGPQHKVRSPSVRPIASNRQGRTRSNGHRPATGTVDTLPGWHTGAKRPLHASR